MQNRYVGDVGDFGKYGLLRSLFKDTDKRLGVNWYLVPDETHTNDGKHIDYLNKPAFRSCDPVLFDQLQQLVSKGQRDVSFVERSGLLPPGTVFFSTTVPSGQQGYHRYDWFSKSLHALKGCDALFLDPDNGLEVASVSSGSDKLGKYVLYQDIAKYYRAGFSLIVYNHRDRSKEDDYQKRFTKISDTIGKHVPLPIMRFRRYSVRDYVFVLQDDLREVVTEGLVRLARSPWAEHWEYFTV